MLTLVLIKFGIVPIDLFHLFFTIFFIAVVQKQQQEKGWLEHWTWIPTQITSDTQAARLFQPEPDEWFIDYFSSNLTRNFRVFLVKAHAITN